MLWKKRNSQFTVGGNVNWYSHYGKQYEDFSKKLRKELPYDPANPLLGIHPKFLKTFYSQRSMHLYVIATLLTVAETWRQPVSCNQGLDTEDVVRVYNRILLSHKKKRWNTAICNNVDGPWKYHAKQNNIVRKSLRTIMILCICMT